MEKEGAGDSYQEIGYFDQPPDEGAPPNGRFRKMIYGAPAGIIGTSYVLLQSPVQSNGQIHGGWLAASLAIGFDYWDNRKKR